MSTGSPTLSEDMTSFNLEAYLKDRQALVETSLDASIPMAYPEKIYESMRYSLLAGGKRLRPILCIATCELLGGTAAMSMDNDDFRRGKPTNHKVYGEDIAILAGDGLLAYAFEYLTINTDNVDAKQLLKVVARLGKAVSAAGLVGGQVVDLDSEGKTNVSVETLNFIHAHKTGALLEASVLSGADLAGANEEQLNRLRTYAQNIGLAFQIIDDILDITATAEELGKTAGKDLAAQKATYPSLWGLEESKVQANKLIAEAKDALSVFGDDAAPLEALADFITTRKS